MGDTVIEKVQKLIRDWFYPPEGKIIASQVRSQANEVRRLSADLSRIKNDLDSCWVGKSHNRFMFLFNPMSKSLDVIAGFLETQANLIEGEKGLRLIIKWIEKVL